MVHLVRKGNVLIIHAADLFCGAGGSSTGLANACRSLGYKLDLLAINHWQVAIQTHTANHPDVRHLCESLDNINPRKVCRDRLDLLVASPECIHHSNARGGRPMLDQSRASAWHVLRWAESLRIDNIIIENVPEFLQWGPLGANGRPLKSRKGETFRAWAAALESLGYRVEHRILNAADYGDPTSRRRLFVLARRGNRRIAWPEPTHFPTSGDLFGPRKAYRTAREIIDWSIPGKSIFGRKKPLAEKTLARIEAGIRKFWGDSFLLMLTHGGRLLDIDKPLPVITTAHNGEIALIQPFTVVLRQNGGALSLDAPLPTLTAGGTHLGLLQPFLVKYNGTALACSLDDPLDTVTAKHRYGLVEPAGETRLADILFRMLQPHELAAAMGFPAGYKFAGTKTETVRQIGNAVPVGLAQALCRSVLEEAA